ncbi:MAG: serine hydroxymethyltransferase [Dehalococcoidia bacterium]|nr:serine hydroxymethyltransferase [Dehalococcoidia bacterium]
MPDKEIEQLIYQERINHKENLNLIASENYPSKEVLRACGSVFSTKYAEGYPGKRYYEGCETADEVENLAISRAKELFGCDHVNVQPHSGTQANMAVYLAVLKSSDSVLSMRLDQGGHLSHGSKVNFSGKIYNFNFYGVDRETEVIDYDEVERQAESLKPKLIVCGTSAYSRIIDFDRFSKIAKSVGALLLSDIAHISGLIAGKMHPSPIPFSDFVTTTTHKTLRGPRGAMIMCSEKFTQDIDKAVFPGIQGGPFLNMIAGRAIAFKEAKGINFQEYARNVVNNAKVLSEVITSNGFRVVSGGTDNHQFTVDVSTQEATGSEVAAILKQIGIIVNKNGIPYDNLPPKITSGIRIGTPALTSRGMLADEMQLIGDIISEAIRSRDDNKKLDNLKSRVKDITQEFGFPGYD